MLTSIEGVYRNGQIELKELPADVRGETPVIVTFMGSGDVDLRTRDIQQDKAAELRGALSTFEDWNEPEMALYDDYDAAKSNL